MAYILTNQLRVLAIDPSTKGIGFAVLEGPERLIDWGIKQAEGETDDAKDAECAKIVAELIDRYRPRILALEDASRFSVRKRRSRSQIPGGVRGCMLSVFIRNLIIPESGRYTSWAKTVNNMIRLASPRKYA